MGALTTAAASGTLLLTASASAATLPPTPSTGKPASLTALLPSDAGTIRSCTDDMYKLDCETMTWVRVRMGLAPMPRKGHAIALLSCAPTSMMTSPTSAVLFGGSCAVGSEWDADVYALQLDGGAAAFSIGHLWSKVLRPAPPRHGDDPFSSTASARSSGVVWPSARSGHTLTAVAHNKAVLFGGVDPAGTLLNDVHVFNIDQATLSSSLGGGGGGVTVCQPWRRVPTQGRLPTPRHSHTAAFLPEIPGKRPPSMIVYGGVSTHNDQLHFPKELYLLDLVHCVWSQVVVGYAFPAARGYHSLVSVPGATPSSSPLYLVFGGMHSMYCTGDVWQLRCRHRRTRLYGTIKQHAHTAVDTSNADGTPNHNSNSRVRFAPLDEGVCDGAEGDDVDSGSDGEDWIVEGDSGDVDGEDNRVEGVLTLRHTRMHASSDSKADPATVTADTKAPHGPAALALDELQSELFRVRKDLIRSREQHASEVSRRQRAEGDRDAAALQAAQLSRQLHENTAKYEEHVAALTMEDLRLEGWKAHAERLQAQHTSKVGGMTGAAHDGNSRHSHSSEDNDGDSDDGEIGHAAQERL